MLDRQPTLEGLTSEGKVLLLRPLRADDWDALFAVACDPLIWEQHPAHDRWQEPVFRAFFADALAQGGALALVDTATGKIIGSSRYQGLEPANGGSIEIGWTFLSRSVWGGATNLAMKRLMVGHALSSIAECRFAVGTENWRSRKAMEKIGGRLSTRTDMRGMAGEEVLHIHYVIGRTEFEGGPLGRDPDTEAGFEANLSALPCAASDPCPPSAYQAVSAAAKARNCRVFARLTAWLRDT